MGRHAPPEPWEQIPLRLTPSQRSTLQALAKQRNVTLSEVIRSLIEGAGSVWVEQVACRHGELIYTLPRPARHGDVMRMANRNGNDAPFGPDEQGFLLSDGTFADREKAYTVARAAGQPWLRDPAITSGHLFTEDLW